MLTVDVHYKPPDSQLDGNDNGNGYGMCDGWVNRVVTVTVVCSFYVLLGS